MRPIGLVLPLLATLAACQQAAPPAAAPSHTAAAPAPTAPPEPAATARNARESTDLYEFDYSYPAAAAAIPALRDWLEADLMRTRAGLASDAKEGRTDSKANGYPFNPYSAGSAWQVVASLPGWLSLSATVSSFSGGAHPNSAFDALLWDKAANVRRAASDLFTSKAALKAAVLKPFCTELTRERAKRRGDEALGDPTDEFNQCIDPLDQTVILGSKSHKAFDRIGFLIAPYNAGPYAEGSYEVTLPVTPAVLAAVKPDYRAAFLAP